MHPMPREGTETKESDIAIPPTQCILCPVRGRKLYSYKNKLKKSTMHPMPREGTETAFALLHVCMQDNASYAP